MNERIFETGYTAYQQGDWSAAASAFAQAKIPGEVDGKLDHLRGNALMQVGRYDEAAEAYGEALRDSSYGMVGALSTNRGRALLAAGKAAEAIDSLTAATKDASYKTPFKAYMALGSACRAVGDVRGAGIAYRNAAIDESNPDPCASLRKLGGCFMDLGRPADAIESYRTALDFSQDLRNQNAVYCELALAYVAANRMNEAVDAFDHAVSDGTYTLSSEAQAAYDAARNAVAARGGQQQRKSDTDEFLNQVGYGDSFAYDPLDPTGETSGNLMPSPEDTGFFSLSEEELVDSDRRARRGIGGKVFAVVLVLLLIVAGACGFAYYSGFGWPTQESVVQDLFAAKTNHDDVAKFVAPGLSEEERQQIIALVPAGAEITITGVDRSMSSSEVLVTASLPEGGEQSYTIKLARDGIGWKVSAFEPIYVSLQTDAAVEGGDSTEGESAEGEAAPAEGEAAEGETAPAEGEAEAAPAEGEAAPAEGEAANDDANVSEGTITE